MATKTNRKVLLDELATLQRRMTQIKQELAETEAAPQGAKPDPGRVGWEMIVDVFPQLICWLDAQQRIVRANKTVELWDLARVAEARGKELPELLHGEEHEAYYNLKLKLQQGWPKVLRGERLELTFKAIERNLQLYVYPLPSEFVYQHELVRFVAIIEDVTGDKSHDEGVQQTMEELIHLNAVKDKFFSIVAHDLKGSFQPFLNFTELIVNLPEKTDPAKIRRMAQSVNFLARNIYNLLENLLQWSRFQMARITFDPNMIELQEVVERTVDLLSTKAEEKGISLSYDVPAELVVYADEHMLDAVIRNLVSNAMKFTPTGGEVRVWADLKLLADMDKNDQTYPLASHVSTASAYIEVSVSDTGVGISKEDLQKLFKISEYHSTVGTANEQGTGLGLILCQEMVTRNGGVISVESELGVGTTVKFTLPADAMS